MNFNRLRRIVEPSQSPVDLDDAKLHLRVDGSLEDDLIQSLIDAATAVIDGPTGIGIALCPQTYRLSLDSLPATITIPVYPVRSIVSIAWIDLEGEAQTTEDFRDDLDSNPARIYLDAAKLAKPGSAKITFIAGFTTVPADLRQAILMLVGHFYANREAVGSAMAELPLGVATILERYRCS